MPASMRLVWLIPMAIFVLGAGIALRVRHRANHPRPLTTEPLSNQWLAEARSREEHHW